MGFTTAYGTSVLDHIFRNQALTPASTVYVGYAKAYTNPTTATEVTGTEVDGYVRQALGASAASASHIENGSAITFPAALAPHNACACALFTATSSGTQITDWKALTAGNVSLAIGQQFRIAAGDYDETLS